MKGKKGGWGGGSFPSVQRLAKDQRRYVVHGGKEGGGGERKTNLSDGNGIKGTPGALAINEPPPSSLYFVK